MDSASLELDEAAGVLSYEEYHPYGSTAFHSAKAGAEVSAKRYRYTGKERDEETGLYYHGARYYAPWLGRWTAADPAGLVDGLNLYRYSRGNPIRFSDPSGTESDAGFNEDQTVYTDEQGVQFSYEENKENPFDPDPHIVFPDDPLVVVRPGGKQKSKPKPKLKPESEPGQKPKEAPEPEEDSLLDDAVDFVRDSSTAQFGIGIGLGIGLGFAPGGFLVSGGGSLSGLDENLPPAIRAGIGIGETLAGLSEIATGIGGEVGSLGLSATGIGAVAGVPGAVASAALIAEGIADVGTGMAVFAKALDDGAANSTPSSTGGPQPGQVPSKPSSTKLGKNLEDAGSARPPGTAAHHIVAGDAKGAEQARQVLKKYGIDINDASNGVFLPRFKSSPNPNGAAVHSKLHSRKYYETVNDALSQATSKAEVLEVLESLRLDLLGGGL